MTRRQIQALAGLETLPYLSGGGERTNLIVMEQFNTLEQARAFAKSDYLREAMEREGIVGAPEILIVDGLEEGPA